MKEKIVENLQRIETQDHVVIFYTCESGSRAWGFPSKDSDFDVRFLYVRPVDWYLSIVEKRDVIERPLTDQLDIRRGNYMIPSDMKRRICTWSRNWNEI